MRIEIEKLKKEKENLLDYVEKKNQAIKELEDKCGQTEMNLRLVEQERD
jgi:prefoldin subunit 5